MNVFSWSIPFVAEKVTEMLYHLIKPNKKIEITEKNKLMSDDELNLFQSLLSMHKTQTNENMELVSLEGATPDAKLLDSGIYESLKEEKKKTTHGKSKFEKNKGLDRNNEKRPEK